MPRELPPTAGLPLQVADLLPWNGAPAHALADVLGLPPLIIESSGSAALWIALETLKAGQPTRRVVLVPAFTCPLVALAVHQAGLVLKICDTRAGHFDLDTNALQALCNEDTLAVIVTHLGGRVADTPTAVDIARRAGAKVIEDAAQALGARAAGRSVGLCGDIGFFSLGAGKGLSIYAGGLLMARDPVLHAALARTHAALVHRRPLREAWRALQLIGLALLYNPLGLVLAYGAPLRRALARGDLIGALSERFAARIPVHEVGRWRRSVATRAARRLPAFQAAARQRARAHIAGLAQLPGLVVLQDAPGDQGTWPYLLLRMPDAASRDRALAGLWAAGLGVSRAFCCALPDYPELAGIVPATDVPNARDFASRTLTLSNTHWLTETDFARIHARLAAAIDAR